MRHVSKLFVPSISNFFFVVFFLVLLMTPRTDLLKDCDTGFHIRTGEYILKTNSIPKYDFFSFSPPSFEWINTEWLSDVIMALIHKAYGLTGVVIFFAFLISFIFYVLFFKIIRKNNVNIVFATLLTLIITLLSQTHLLARPHIFSWIFILIWYYILDSFWYKQRNYLYFLPPIILLWVNLHGSFILGFVLITIYLIGSVIDILRVTDKDFSIRKAKLLGLTAIACLLVSLINPYTYRILLYPFELASNKFVMDHINEFMSPNFHESIGMVFEFLLLLTIGILAFSTKRLNSIELMLMLFFTHMALYSGRGFVYFSIIIGPILAKHAESLLEESNGRLANFIRKRADNIERIDASAKGYIWIVLAIVVIAIGAIRGKIRYEFDQKLKPVAALQFLKRENLKGNMFNNDEFGDYIIYSAYPQYKVFIDGRIGAVYDSERLKEYLKVSFSGPGWDGVIKKYNIDWIIFDNNSILSRFLMENKNWHLVYSDKVANIFVRNILEYQDLINKYPNVKPVIVEEDK